MKIACSVYSYIPFICYTHMFWLDGKICLWAHMKSFSKGTQAKDNSTCWRYVYVDLKYFY